MRSEACSPEVEPPFIVHRSSFIVSDGSPVHSMEVCLLDLPEKRDAAWLHLLQRGEIESNARDRDPVPHRRRPGYAEPISVHERPSDGGTRRSRGVPLRKTRRLAP